jgi:hypothetical protein
MPRRLGVTSSVWRPPPIGDATIARSVWSVSMAYDVDHVAVWRSDEEPTHPPRLCRDRLHDLIPESLSFCVGTVDVVGVN